MVLDLSRPFVIDDVTGDSPAYADLWSRIGGARVEFRPCCQPRSLADLASNLLAALVADQDITLVDETFSPQELADLGLASSDLTRVVPAPSRHRSDALASLLDAVRDRSRGTIRIFTSGSTGLPKAVRHRLPSLCRALRLGPRHATATWGFAYSPSHIAGIQVLFQALFNGNPLVHLFGRSRTEIWKAIHDHRVSHLSATPTFYRLLLPAEQPAASVVAVTLGGESTDATLLRQLRAAFPQARVRNVYASTEAGTLLAADGDAFSVPPELADRIRIVDAHLHLHATLLGDFDRRPATVEGWYDTGDVVEPVEDRPGSFRILSRDRDWINVGGYKVNPAEVEAVLRSHAGVREARVFGRPQSLIGNLVCADVVRADPALTEVELRAFLAPRLQSYKQPRLVQFRESLEQTRTGKLKRHE